ncbi:MAG TPA: CoA transferase [Acidimicrobiales bacterium]|nr:CoA transferase [Acidimicrobiales bacterium]
MTGVLTGLHVLEVATGIAGPYAGRLLALLGADVVKVEPAGGDPSRRMAVDDRPPAADEPGPLFVHLNAGKHLRGERPAEGWAHVVLDDRVRSERAGTTLDPELLAAAGATVVSMTAWGYDADEAGRPADELLVQAASGMLQATIDDGRPYRFPGWQSQYLAGAFGVAGALTALADHGSGHHVDVSWVGSMLTGVEAGVCAYLNAAEQPPRPKPEGGRDRQAGFQVGAFPAGVFRCNDGHVIPGTVRPVDWTLQCGVYDRPDLLEDERFDGVGRFTHRDELRAELQPWYDAHTKTEIFESALTAGWACGMVMTAADALGDPHLAARGFLASDAPGVARPWLVTPPPAIPPAGAVPAPPPLARLKVIELTWAWAGPFVGRFLGAYGADVVRIEAGSYPDGWRTRLKWKQTGSPIPDGADPDGYTWDAAALHNSLNRNKRSLSLDLTHPEGRALFLELLPNADLLVLNMSYRMLADRGIEDDVMAAVADGLVVLNMPALGATGPYRDMPGYGILMEGMGGFAARYGRRDEGARSTNTYYPDLVAGLHGTIAALATLAACATTGDGRFIDLSQQEVTWLQFGEALVLAETEGREVDRLGDGEPGMAPSGYYPCLDRRWLALVVRDGREYEALRRIIGPGAPAASASERCARRDELDALVAEWTSRRSVDDAVAALREAGVTSVTAALRYEDVHRGGLLEDRGMLERLVHSVTGDRPYVGLPVRIDGVAWRSRRPAACFAQHTDEVLQDWLDLEEDRLSALRAADVIGTTPGRRRDVGK